MLIAIATMAHECRAYAHMIDLRWSQTLYAKINKCTEKRTGTLSIVVPFNPDTHTHTHSCKSALPSDCKWNCISNCFYLPNGNGKQHTAAHVVIKLNYFHTLTHVRAHCSMFRLLLLLPPHFSLFFERMTVISIQFKVYR